MFYDIINKMDDLETDEYCWEEIDGLPRYRWYKRALNTFHLIIECDNHHDIENRNFSDLNDYFEAMEWVAQNDPKALEHIINKLIPPTNHVVENIIINHLTALEYYKSSAIIKNSLQSIDVPKNRSKERKREKLLTKIEDIEKYLGYASDHLKHLKTNNKEKLFDKNTLSSIATLTNLNSSIYEEITEYLDDLEWIHKNYPNDVESIFKNTEILVEIKDQFLDLITQKELYGLRICMDNLIIGISENFYYKIPEFIPDPDAPQIDF